MTKSFHFSKLAGASLLMMATLIVGQTSPAEAGFNWTPPVAKNYETGGMVAAPQATNKGPLTPEPDSMTAAPVAAPVTNVDAAALPVPGDNKQPSSTGMKTLPMKNDASMDATPNNDLVAKDAAMKTDAPAVDAGYKDTQEPLVLDNTRPAEEPAKTEPVKTADTSDDNAQVQGFGKDIPLALALRDIVPTGYAYAFANGSIAGTKISWQGGKPWKQVLNESLAVQHLAATVEGHVIRVAPATSTTVASTPTAEEATPVTAPATAPAPATDKPLDLTATHESTPTAEKAPETASYSAKKASMDVDNKREWQARPGSTLHQILGNWSKDANVELQWVSPYDFPINNAFVFQGTYQDAVSAILASYSRENPRPRGRLYPNAPDGPSVLMVN